jgi:hypothetical protein
MAGTTAGLSASAGIRTDGAAAADGGFREGRTEDERAARVVEAGWEVAGDIAVRRCGTVVTGAGARSDVQPAQTTTQRIAATRRTPPRVDRYIAATGECGNPRTSAGRAFQRSSAILADSRRALIGGCGC